jgi:hypothetical protein
MFETILPELYADLQSVLLLSAKKKALSFHLSGWPG